MRKFFSEELIADINKQLDLEGLQSLDDKQIAVILSEQIISSSTFVVDELTKRLDNQTQKLMAHAVTQTDRLIRHTDDQTQKLTAHAEVQTSRLMAHAEVQTERLMAHNEAQTERLMKHNEVQTTRIIGELDGIRDQIENIHKAIKLIHEDFARFRTGANLLIVTLWGVIASIIANIIFQIVMK